MRYTEILLNGQKFQMPAISLGTVWFGSKTTKEMSHAMMDTYTGLGGNWIDTARLYGYPCFPEQELKEKYDSDAIKVVMRRFSGARVCFAYSWF